MPEPADLSHRQGRPGHRTRAAPQPDQMALAAASLSNGIRPAPRLLLAVNVPDEIGSCRARSLIQKPCSLRRWLKRLQQIWLHRHAFLAERSCGNFGVDAGSQSVSWFLGGTLPAWQGSPLVVVVVLEVDSPWQAVAIGQTLLQSSTHPRHEETR